MDVPSLSPLSFDGIFSWVLVTPWPCHSPPWNEELGEQTFCWANRHHACDLFLPFLPQSVLPWPGLNSTESRVLGEQLVSPLLWPSLPHALSFHPVLALPHSLSLPLRQHPGPHPGFCANIYPCCAPRLLFSSRPHGWGSAPPLQRAWHPNWYQTNG